MNKSESIKNLAVALKKAQSEIGGVEFDSNNPFFKSKYASLGAVIQASKDALVKNGFAISQPTTSNEFGVGITTILMHETGEWIEDTVTIPLPGQTYVDKNGELKQNNFAQEAGKIITYLRRYSLASILNLYSDEDMDGEATKAKAPAPKTMLLETANNVKNSEKIPYGDIDSNTLSNMSLGIAKALKKTDITDGQRTEYAMKRDAIVTILKARNEK